jgi:UDP-galactopyranose mutase
LNIESNNYDLLVVGSGLFGLTVAQHAASDGFKVCIIEKRDHIGGNAYSYFDDSNGIEVHKYGSHLFHTSNARVWRFVNKFSSFTPYIHRVLTNYQGKIYSMPINLGTLTSFYDKALTPSEAKAIIEAEVKKDYFASPQNLEEKAISLIGKKLYDAFIRGYTKKQWQIDPKDLPSEIITRLPVRFNFNSSYFSDRWQGLPEVGYEKWLHLMSEHENIDIFLNLDYFEIQESIDKKIPVVYSGPIDKFFNYQFGRLTWRTLDFDFKKLDTVDFQGTSVMNYADEEVPYTRIHEFKHLHPERDYFNLKATVVAYEFSRFAEIGDEPYYPVNLDSDRKKLNAYRELSKSKLGFFFGGRLGSYKYLDMHMAIASGINKWENEIKTFLLNRN